MQMVVITITQDKALAMIFTEQSKVLSLEGPPAETAARQYPGCPGNQDKCQPHHPCRQSSMVVKHSWSLKTFLDVGEPS